MTKYRVTFEIDEEVEADNRDDAIDAAIGKSQAAHGSKTNLLNISETMRALRNYGNAKRVLNNDNVLHCWTCLC